MVELAACAFMEPYRISELEGTLLESGLNRLNSLSADEARLALLACCGSRRWAEEIADHRPFSTFENLDTSAKTVWWSLASEDWMEAFLSHPKIGEQEAQATKSEATRRWSAQEQGGMVNANREVKQTLQELNRRYQEKFGYIFIVCATGKTSEELLAILRSRLDNDPAAELKLAATEQAKITTLRLQKLLNQ